MVVTTSSSSNSNEIQTSPNVSLAEYDISHEIINDDNDDDNNNTSTGAGTNGVEVKAQFTTDLPVDYGISKPKAQTSPLLSSTPPTVAKSLIRAYPYLLIINKLLSIATWTNDDYWINIIIISIFSLFILYFENLVIWLGHIIIVGIITLYTILNNKILEETKEHPTLDDVVQSLTATCIKADMLLNPITSLAFTSYDIKRLLFTTIFLTPLYLIVSFLVIKPRIILLITGIYMLTYHSSYSRVIRRIVWKIKLARLLVFYLTGLDFSQAKNSSLFAAAFAKVQKSTGLTTLNNQSSTNNKPVRFTYVIYENQRRWLGIGWTSNLLSYERAPWTDEFLNESSSVDAFKLPNANDAQSTGSASGDNGVDRLDGATWRWVDKTWRLDLTNDGAITLQNNKRSKTNANPGSDEGFIYYDNTWKKPSTEDSFSKYTRRRRWIRTAELVFDNAAGSNAVVSGAVSSGQQTEASLDNSHSTSSKRKSLRFSEVVVEHDEKKPALESILSEEEEEEEEDEESQHHLHEEEEEDREEEEIEEIKIKTGIPEADVQGSSSEHRSNVVDRKND
ncbi:uncharacterized protein RJT21DRAFT_109350 [Scheffersomyces amazonensis]|uniref:uncharacterized protein n=1 Tax=Scheffersomyces amazonensis TaxID=1078765 RepID=UPI00315E0214